MDGLETVWIFVMKIFFGILAVLLSWIGFDNRAIKKRIKDMEDKHNKFEVHIAANYITKSDLKDTEDRIIKTIQELKKDRS